MKWDELGKSETAHYSRDLLAMNVLAPSRYVKASDYTHSMFIIIEALLAKDLAYVHDGWVYYSVRSDRDFGKLAEAGGYEGYASWLATANERGNNPHDARKRDPLDFVLWQGQAPGEPAWDSPWGRGRPGWHIECSAMATALLGPRIDIHGGGGDLIFPHHTCEIAQSEHATNERPFVGHWMHCAMVYQDGQKMSKSLGNLTLISNLLRSYSADAIRIMLLGHHYRSVWEYHPDDMRASSEFAAELAAATREASDAEPSGSARAAFISAMENDLDVPAALEVLRALLGRAHESPAEAAELRALAAVLGLTLGGQPDATPWPSPWS
ncbi:MAG TPA: class I tRNA ligase family protein, partial [Ktedonobacterales bacterium]